ncbi:DNA repair protein REV1 isoform X4 [Lotus japonicus]|uniref:DNA repair protein REV1 isoform X4 n=1 Tax=Lotus japonicus TaxID=34305 RepID=UPI0025867D53|nr:DNA repair protein REV1 isoform X4 [Lotus japonicus]
MSLDSFRSSSSSGSGSGSGSGSKRTSSFSNATNKTKTKTKKKKTLGVAWGSNALPPSDFSGYMALKNRKLHDQFHAQSSSSTSTSTSGKPIFTGVSIFVDGFTVPSSQELRGYMFKYGGRFENYFSRHRVTHIICSNLPHTKLKNLRAFSAGLPLVKPTWILDSVAANRLLPWLPYQLHQLANNQPTLSAFFSFKTSKLSDMEDSTTNVCQSQDRHSSKVNGLISTVSNDTIPENENTNAFMLEDSTNLVRVKYDEGSTAATQEKTNVQDELEPNHQEPSTSVSSPCSDDQNVKEFQSSAATRLSKQGHSTLTDPNFVENYFKSSRLHFIGTWRNRYRKRFPMPSAGLNKEISNNSSDVSRNSVIIHVDMDCFFVSVVIRSQPELFDKPVAVCHSNNSKGTSEISSANYPARSYGIKAGMFVRDAKALCPDLVIFPYNFEAYEEVADQFYTILHRHCNKVQAVSCDEAFLDVTHSEVKDPELLASSIREEICKTTRCTASAGIAGNMLMARIATRTAKPNGQYHITPERVDDYLCQLPIDSLPGVGHVLQEKLKKQNVHTCGQLRTISKALLQKDYGMKTGEMLWNYSRGIDSRAVGVFQESKSIGADVNWGVRFNDVKDCDRFLIDLCKEVSLRLQCCGVQGRTFSLKIKKRRKDAVEPAKFMGCGDCENLSHSITIPLATDNVEVLQRIVKQLFGCFYIDVKEIRGIGLQVSRFESAETSKQEKYSLKSWVASGNASMQKQKYPMDQDKQNMDGTSSGECRGGSSVKIQNNQANANPISTPPPLCHLDVEVIRNLPPEVFSELNEIYGGKLIDYIAKGKGTSETSSSLQNLFLEQETAIDKEEELLNLEPIPQRKLLSEIEAMQHGAEQGDAVSGSGCGPIFKVTHSSSFEKDDLLPSSLSQIDGSVLRQLPEDLKAVIVQQLPAHRTQEICSNGAMVPPSENHHVSLSIKTSENPGSSYSVLDDSLWTGNPPKWVEKFKVSSCLLLKIFAEIYSKSGLSSTLSSVLHQIISEFHQLNLAHQISDETVNIISELLKQYIKVRIGRDIEEIYICFRLLKRQLLMTIMEEVCL